MNYVHQVKFTWLGQFSKEFGLKKYFFILFILAANVTIALKFGRIYAHLRSMVVYCKMIIKQKKNNKIEK